MDNFINQLQDPFSDLSYLWDASSFQYGDPDALEIETIDDGDSYILHAGTQMAAHPLMTSSAQEKIPPSDFLHIAESQPVQTESLIHYQLNSDFVADLPQDYVSALNAGLPTAETLSPFDPSSQSVNREEECTAPELLESSELPPHQGLPAPRRLRLCDPPTSEEWEMLKEVLRTYYMDQRRPVPEVQDIMRKKYGFKAKESTFKARFIKWGWRKKPRTNKEPQKPTFSLTDTSTLAASTGYMTASARGIREYAWNENLYEWPNSWIEVPEAPPTPPLQCALVPGGTIPIKLLMDDLLTNVSKVYHPGQIALRGWKIEDPFQVLENEYDSLFVSVVNFTWSSPLQGSRRWRSGIQKVFSELGPVIDSCGLFALPTIWTCTLRLLEENQVAAAIEFLLKAQRLAREHKREEPFQQIIDVLPSLVDKTTSNTNLLQNGLREIYLRCLGDVDASLSSSKPTLLSLRSFFVNYVDKTDEFQQGRSITDAYDLVQKSTIRNGANSDVTLNIMGQYLFTLQSNPRHITELETMTRAMEHQIRRRRRKYNTHLQGSLLLYWKDMKHIVAEYHYRRNDLTNAISALHEYTRLCPTGTGDGFDKIVRSKLYAWKKEYKKMVSEPDEHTGDCNNFCGCAWKEKDWNGLKET